jgi:hypothetical protein
MFFFCIIQVAAKASMEAQHEDQTLAIASLEAELTSLQAGLATKNPPKKIQKTHLKKTTKKI